MQYDAVNPAEYLKMLEDDWRKEKLEQLRKIIKESSPEIVEGMQYKMLAFGLDGHNIFHLNAQRNYVSLYVGNIDKVEGAKELLKEFDKGKGCIRIKKKNDLFQSNITEFIKRTIETRKKGGETDC